MTNYLKKGDAIFSVALAYLLTWSNALNLETFGLREAVGIVWLFLLNFVIVMALLWVSTLFTKKPIFGQTKAYYFPTTHIIIIAMVCMAVFALINYLTGSREMTTQRIWTYIIGYVIGVVVITIDFYFLLIKK